MVMVTVTVKNFKLEILLKMIWHSPSIYRRPQKMLGQLSSLKFFTLDPYFGGMFKTGFLGKDPIFKYEFLVLFIYPYIFI